MLRDRNGVGTWGERGRGPCPLLMQTVQNNMTSCGQCHVQRTTVVPRIIACGPW